MKKGLIFRIGLFLLSAGVSAQKVDTFPFTPRYSTSVCPGGLISLGAEGAPAYLTWTDLRTNTIVATGNNVSVTADNTPGIIPFRVCGSNNPAMGCPVCYDFSVTVNPSPSLIENISYMETNGQVIFPSYQAINGNMVTTCMQPSPFLEFPQYSASVSLYAQEFGGYIARGQGQFPNYFPVYHYNYLWSTGATTPIIDVNLTQTTTYTVIVFDQNTSCTQTKTFTIKVPTMRVIECVEDIASRVKVEVLDGEAPYTYKLNNSTVSPNNNSNTYDYTGLIDDDIYDFSVITQGCTLAKANYQVCETGLGRESAKPMIVAKPMVELYPNPAGDEFNISYRLPENSMYKGAVYDVQGKEMTTFVVSGTSGEQTVSTRNWTSGVYLFKFFDKERLVLTQKIVIIH